MNTQKPSKKPSKVKLLPIPKLVAKADKVFSNYIRSRDANTLIQNEEGLSLPAGSCITCSRIIAVKQGHCGHFIQRGCKPTRFDPRNASLQCPYDNTYRYGEQYRHGLAIDRKFGAGTSTELLELENRYKRDGHKWTRDELNEVIERYT